MAREAKKRMGRPPRNPPTRGKRVSLGLKVTAEVKRHLDSAFRTSGRTQSQEAEHLIEKALSYDQLLESLRTLTSRLASFRKEHHAAPLRRSGRTQLQADPWAELLAICAAFAEGDIVEAALERRNWRRDGTTGHWIPPEVHRLPPGGSIEQSAPAAKRRDK